MKLATWNVNGIHQRLPQLLAWLAATQPDVVALQEVKTTTEAFPAAAIEAAGYGCHCVGQKTWNGVALLARGTAPVVTRSALPGDADDRQSRYVEAAVDGVLVACLYAPNGNPWPGPKFDYKLAWHERLIAHAATLIDSGLPVALIGDFNVVPTDADIYSPASWLDNALLQPEARAAHARLLAQGWTDALRAAQPAAWQPGADGKAAAVPYTFWDHRRNRWPRNAGLRIDHLLLSPALAPRLRTAGVDRELRALEHASDHAPAWADLASTAGARSDQPGTAKPRTTAGRSRKAASARATFGKSSKPTSSPAP